MPASTVQLPPDSTGKMLRHRSRTEGANTVHEPYVALGGEPTWDVWTGPLTFAQNKHFLSFFNATGSAQVIKVRGLYLINLQTAAVTGVAAQFEWKRITAITGGTAVVPVIRDSTDTALTNLTCVTAPTSVTEGATNWQQPVSTDEIVLTDAASRAWQQTETNLVPESIEGKEYEMNPGEGWSLKQTLAATVGSFGVLAIIARAL